MLIHLIPRIYYHAADNFEDEFDLIPRRYKGEPVSLSLAILLGVGITAGIGTGAATLATGQQGLNALSTAINENLEILEKSITHLEKNLRPPHQKWCFRIGGD